MISPSHSRASLASYANVPRTSSSCILVSSRATQLRAPASRLARSRSVPATRFAASNSTTGSGVPPTRAIASAPLRSVPRQEPDEPKAPVARQAARHERREHRARSRDRHHVAPARDGRLHERARRDRSRRASPRRSRARRARRPRGCSTTRAQSASVACASSLSSGFPAMPRCVSSCRVRRVSSAPRGRSRAASRLPARVMSPRLPMGVATTKSVPPPSRMRQTTSTASPISALRYSRSRPVSRCSSWRTRSREMPKRSPSSCSVSGSSATRRSSKIASSLPLPRASCGTRRASP